MKWSLSSFKWVYEGECETLRDEQGRCIAQIGPNSYGMAGPGWTRTVINDPATGRQVSTGLSIAPPMADLKRKVEEELKKLEADQREDSLPVLGPLKFVTRKHEIRDVDICEIQEADGVLLATLVPTPDGSLRIVSKYAVDAFEDSAPMPHPVPGQPPVRAFVIKLDKTAAANVSSAV